MCLRRNRCYFFTGLVSIAQGSIGHAARPTRVAAPRPETKPSIQATHPLARLFANDGAVWTMLPGKCCFLPVAAEPVEIIRFRKRREAGRSAHLLRHRRGIQQIQILGQTVQFLVLSGSTAALHDHHRQSLHGKHRRRRPRFGQLFPCAFPVEFARRTSVSSTRVLAENAPRRVINGNELETISAFSTTRSFGGVKRRAARRVFL